MYALKLATNPLSGKLQGRHPAKFAWRNKKSLGEALHFCWIKKNIAGTLREGPGAHLYIIGFLLSVCYKQGCGAVGRRCGRPEGWAGGEYGAATVGGNYGFLSFLAGFRDVYARGKYKRPRLAGSSLGRMGRGR